MEWQNLLEMREGSWALSAWGGLCCVSALWTEGGDGFALYFVWGRAFPEAADDSATPR